MKNARPLAQGEKVTVWTTFDKIRYWKGSVEIDRLRDPRRPSAVLRGRVRKPWRRGAHVRLTVSDGGFVDERIYLPDEGKLWVRGWDTEEALAMIVGEALR